MQNCFSKLILGTVQLGMPYGIGQWKNDLMPEADAFRILSSAWEKGITTLDTSPEYGVAEERIARFMKENRTKKFNIVSKIKNIPDGKHFDKSFLEDWFLKSPFMGLDNCLSLSLFLHNEADIQRKNVINVLDEAVSQNKLLGWGVSVYDPKFAISACEVETCAMVQLPFSALNQAFGRDRIIEKLLKRKKLVMARSIFLQGLLLDSIKYLPGVGEECSSLIANLYAFLEENNISLCEFAISLALSEPGINNIVVGADSQEHVLAWNTAPCPIKEFNLPTSLIRDLRLYENAAIKPHMWRSNSNEAREIS